MRAYGMFQRGYVDLIPIIPPTATLSPGSSIRAESLGKIPGKRLPNGTWIGFDWRKYTATLADVEQWDTWQASVGLKSDRFPGVDIDSLDEIIAAKMQQIAFEHIGPSPIRTGRFPKRLLMYRCDVPCGKVRLEIRKNGVSHVVEILWGGQQYVVEGIHPITKEPYKWNGAIENLPPEKLTLLDTDKVEQFLTALKAWALAEGFEIGGGARATARVEIAPELLRAPSDRVLREAMALVPNDQRFNDRGEYIKMAAAIRASTDDDVLAFELFSAWAERWEEGHNSPETLAADFDSLRPPYQVGWSWIAELAKAAGYNQAGEEFPVVLDPKSAAPDVTTPPVTVESGPVKPQLTDSDLGDRVLAQVGQRLRFAPESGKWYVWDGHRWAPDAALLAQNEIDGALRAIAADQMTRGTSPQMVKMIESAGTLRNVMFKIQADRSIAVELASLDADPWLLGTPGGVVDLRTGIMRPADPADLITKSTAVTPKAGPKPEWERYFNEATGNDLTLQRYLLKWGGYVLTGVTREQQLLFAYGRSGTGKGTTLNTFCKIMGDYGTGAGLQTFLAHKSDRHSTEIAGLMGARMVLTGETDSGRDWNESLVKTLTGGDVLRARFLFQDEFELRPTFKIVMMGNNRPHLRSLDDAMRRRLAVVPYTCLPAQVDLQLDEKLQAEWPAILAWLIEGCLLWQQEGLVRPAKVLAATDEYFASEDSLGSWIEERVEVVQPEETVLGMQLYESYRSWCGEQGEKAALLKDLVAALRLRGHEVTKRDGVQAFIGLRVRPEVIL